MRSLIWCSAAPCELSRRSSRLVFRISANLCVRSSSLRVLLSACTEGRTPRGGMGSTVRISHSGRE